MYELLDGEKKNKENPDTFEIPSMEERLAVVPGSWVQLMFYEEDADITERMWVKVTEVSPELSSLTGKLDNDPYRLTSISCDDEVEFERKHVIKILED